MLPGTAVRPATEATFTITPLFCRTRCGNSYFMHSQTPLALMSSTLSQVSSSYKCVTVFMVPPEIPALLRQKSNWPNSRIPASTIASTCAAWLTSHRTNRLLPPPRRMVSATSAPVLSFTSDRMTAAPCRANSPAASLPIPEAAPVMRATLCWKGMETTGEASPNPLRKRGLLTGRVWRFQKILFLQRLSKPPPPEGVGGGYVCTSILPCLPAAAACVTAWRISDSG